MDNDISSNVAPTWIRLFFAVLAAAVIVKISLSLFGVVNSDGTSLWWYKALGQLSTYVGMWLFTFIALTGRLPGFRIPEDN